MSFDISIPTVTGSLSIAIESGASVVFVGANGTGKTRLAVYLEKNKAEAAHRISAHRALTLNPKVAKVSESDALKKLRYGQADSVSNISTVAFRPGVRWRSQPAVSLLSDFDFLLQALFADQSNKALVTHNSVRAGNRGPANPTNFEILADIWDRLHPHRRLIITGDDIKVAINYASEPYSATDMSDGERATFYLLGQALTAEKNSLLIVDEPELHLHPAIITRLWDEIESARPDCAFVFITHDLNFASSKACLKYVISRYEQTPAWDIEPVEEDRYFTEELVTLILGSRKPILFVEGAKSSLDRAVYRCCYPNWTIIPRGSCEDVIHSVATMRQNTSLTRLACAGIVDADDRNDDDKAVLQRLGISVLPVSEIENIFLLPRVSKAIAQTEEYEVDELERRLQDLKQRAFDSLNDPKKIETVVARYCKRRIDRQLKKVDLGEENTVEGIINEFNQKTEAFDISAIASYAKEKIKSSVEGSDISSLLEIYDDKSLITLVATCLKQKRKQDFESWITRILRKSVASDLVQTIQQVLPVIEAT